MNGKEGILVVWSGKKEDREGDRKGGRGSKAAHGMQEALHCVARASNTGLW